MLSAPVQPYLYTCTQMPQLFHWYSLPYEYEEGLGVGLGLGFKTNDS